MVFVLITVVKPILESLRKRFATYETSTKGIIDHYAKLNMVKEVDSSVSKADVVKAVSDIMQKQFPKSLNSSGDN